MNTEETAQQLELAAQILRTGHPWEVWTVGQYEKPDQLTILDCIQSGHKIRLAPDPYAKLKKAHAEGKKMEYFDGAHWNPIDSPSWICSPNHYRIKPDTQPFQLPSPPPGMQWHRTDEWKEGDLPQGWRPLAKGEAFVVGKDGDEYRCWDGSFHWQNWGPSQGDTTHCRTRRPLTFTHEGKQWTWHKAGDPCPVPPNAMIHAYNSVSDIGPYRADSFAWDSSRHLSLGVTIIGWRYANEKKTVPLGPEDVPPGSVLSLKPPRWFIISGINDNGLYILDDEPLVENLWRWDYLMEKAQINRSIPLTGKWNPNAWEPCSKDVDA